jgi:hypothetical protein
MIVLTKTRVTYAMMESAMIALIWMEGCVIPIAHSLPHLSSIPALIRAVTLMVLSTLRTLVAVALSMRIAVRILRTLAVVLSVSVLYNAMIHAIKFLPSSVIAERSSQNPLLLPLNSL